MFCKSIRHFNNNMLLYIAFGVGFMNVLTVNLLHCCMHTNKLNGSEGRFCIKKRV